MSLSFSRSPLEPVHFLAVALLTRVQLLPLACRHAIFPVLAISFSLVSSSREALTPISCQTRTVSEHQALRFGCHHVHYTKRGIERASVHPGRWVSYCLSIHFARASSMRCTLQSRGRGSTGCTRAVHSSEHDVNKWRHELAASLCV